MRIRLLLIIIAATFGCKQQQEAVEKFVFDNTQIATLETHNYDFDTNGRIIADHTTTHLFMGNVPFDSSSHTKRFEYNEKGQTARIFDTRDSTWQFKFYNTIDSLIADYTINTYGDTIRMTIIEYSIGKSHMKMDRLLARNLPEDPEDLTKWGSRNYDTIILKTQFIYEGDRHIKSLSLDRHGKVTKETEFVYTAQAFTKAITYDYLGEHKFVKETSYHKEVKINEPDSWTIGALGDTTAFTKTIFQNEKKVIHVYMGDLNMHDVIYYDRGDRMIGKVMLDLDQQIKTTISYKYDGRGYLIEESSYNEKITTGQ